MHEPFGPETFRLAVRPAHVPKKARPFVLHFRLARQTLRLGHWESNRHITMRGVFCNRVMRLLRPLRSQCSIENILVGSASNERAPHRSVLSSRRSTRGTNVVPFAVACNVSDEVEWSSPLFKAFTVATDSVLVSIDVYRGMLLTSHRPPTNANAVVEARANISRAHELDSGLVIVQAQRPMGRGADLGSRFQRCQFLQ